MVVLENFVNLTKTPLDITFILRNTGNFTNKSLPDGYFFGNFVKTSSFSQCSPNFYMFYVSFCMSLHHYHTVGHRKRNRYLIVHVMIPFFGSPQGTKHNMNF